MRSRTELIDAERRIEAVVRPVIARWLDEVRAVFLYELASANPGLVAAAFSGTSAAVDNANAALRTWNEGLANEIIPEISIVFGEAFQRIRRADEYNSYQYEQDYLLEVESRLKCGRMKRSRTSGLSSSMRWTGRNRSMRLRIGLGGY